MKNIRGQSTVEYILLLAVSMLLMLAVLRSPLFSRFLGGNSDYFATLRSIMTYTYQYGNYVKKNEQGIHPLYDPGRHVVSKKGYGE
ncbi:MAG: hypothetical protein H6622_02295 [Halobacteriovoraceae bacterium]|nr:hypothetical protein [Halobacteriovoraceae bacterium]